MGNQPKLGKIIWKPIPTAERLPYWRGSTFLVRLLFFGFEWGLCGDDLDENRIKSMIANDCYRTGQFYYAAKAFDVLERLDPNPEYWEGKRGACIGWFQRVVADKEPKGMVYNNVTEIKHKFRFIDRSYFDVTKYK